MDIQDSIQALKLSKNRDMIHCSPNVLIDGSTTIIDGSINIIAKKMKKWHSSNLASVPES